MMLEDTADVEAARPRPSPKRRAKTPALCAVMRRSGYCGNLPTRRAVSCTGRGEPRGSQRVAIPTALRFTAYTFTVLILTASLPGVVRHSGITVFRENGPVEWLQFGLIATAGAVFLGGAVFIPRFRRLFLLLTCLPVLAGFRELDALLDEWIPWIGWKIGYVAVLYALVSGYTNKRALKPQLPQFVATPAFAVLWAGFLVALPIAQLVGHGPFLQLAMGGDYVYAYKHMIEEILELTGYVLLVTGSLESVAQLGSVQPGVVPAAATGDTHAVPSRAAAAPSPPAFVPAVSSFLAAPASLLRRARKSIHSSHTDSWRPR